MVKGVAASMAPFDFSLCSGHRAIPMATERRRRSCAMLTCAIPALLCYTDAMAGSTDNLETIWA